MPIDPKELRKQAADAVQRATRDRVEADQAEQGKRQREHLRQRPARQAVLAYMNSKLERELRAAAARGHTDVTFDWQLGWGFDVDAAASSVTEQRSGTPHVTWVSFLDSEEGAAFLAQWQRAGFKVERTDYMSGGGQAATYRQYSRVKVQF